MKKFIITALALITSATTFGQFTFTTGLTIGVSDNKPHYFAIQGNPPIYYTYTTNGLISNGMAYVKYHFGSKGARANDKPLSVSLGSPLLVGASFSNFGTAFSYSIPLMADINVGNCKAGDEHRSLGAFAGVGFGATNTNFLDFSSNPKQINTEPGVKYTTYASIADFEARHKIRGLSIGPMVHAGFQFNLGNVTYGLRGGYQVGLNNYGKDYTFITLIANGAMWGNRLF